MSKELSREAQAVLDAIDGIGNPQWIAQAALRAVSEQVIPEGTDPWDCCDHRQNRIRERVFAIAAELEAAE